MSAPAKTPREGPSSASTLPAVAERFLRYVQIDTRADPESESTPSSEKQKDLSRLLAQELRGLGLADAEMDEHGYVYARLDALASEGRPAVDSPVALLAHVDTSPDEPGGPVRPLIHRDYDGGVVRLPCPGFEVTEVTLDPERSPALLEHVGHDLITSDGSTLLGSDDKAGVAIIMQAVADLLADREHPRPPLRICFTVDEEIGRGVNKLDLERLDAAVGYTVDGGAIGHLDTETFNAAEARLRVQGVMVHPGTAKGVMVNAATVLGKILAALPEAETPERTSGGEGYLCLYQVAGDIASAKARLLLRDFDSDGLERRKRLLQQAVELARLRSPGAQISLEIEDSYRNMRSYIEDRDPRAIEFALAAGRELGLEMSTQRVRGGTDGARLSELGLPTPNLFTGGYDYHSRFEWNTVQNLETSVAYLKAVLRYWAEHG